MPGTFLLHDPSLPERIAHGLQKIGIAMRAREWSAAAPLGLTPTQAQIVVLLARRDGGLRVQEIAEQLAVTVATVSDAVSTLVGKKLACKIADPEDGRARRIQLSKTGTMLAGSLNDWPDLFTQAAAELWPQEQQVLLRSLITMIALLQRKGAVPTARMCVNCQYFRAWRHNNEAAPHHCAYIDAPLAEAELRLDCAEHAPASGEVETELWLHGPAGPGTAPIDDRVHAPARSAPSQRR
ncbi:MarR family winged helix-turn-helix transcriptional regulator [Dyella tabacisoli]|uniref:MarR family transcriptional regulator n=1 Tax=Dyella tabacisoli TaxID=2282381 RepID=A0A369UUE1_9GAMM|nr:MarR family winged helix-turn-helix transcriptional regulator [Dyella tabacisoli]RDD81959.1 MarR family transcriptional regulator [Dyella tabacisoli]